MLTTYTTAIPGYYIKVETFPYDQSRQLVESLTDWWDHPTRRRLSKSNINYDLSSEASNSLNYSFREKLKTGNFSFLHHEDVVLGYQGLYLIDGGGTGLCHRAATNPSEYYKHIGVWSSVFLPWQIKCAYEKGCKYYKAAWNIHNYMHYRALRDNNSPQRFKFEVNKDIWQRFNFVGKQLLNNTEQYVAVLDLQQDWIPSFVEKLQYTSIDNKG